MALRLTDEWDKVFPKNGKLPAIAISGPYGAVKEQSSGLYAQTLANELIFELIKKSYLLSAK